METRKKQARRRHDASGDELPDELGLCLELDDIVHHADDENRADAHGDAQHVDVPFVAELKKIVVPAKPVHAEHVNQQGDNHGTYHGNAAQARNGLFVHATGARVIDRVELTCQARHARHQKQGSQNGHQKKNCPLDPNH